MYKFDLGAQQWPGTTKLVEEAGEVVQVLAKLMGRGNQQHWQGDLMPRIIEELGDLQAAMDFWMVNNLTPEEQLQVLERGRNKREVFQRWHDETLTDRLHPPLPVLKGKQRSSRKPRSKK